MKKIIAFHHSGEIGGAGISLMNTISMLADDYELIVYIMPGELENILKTCNVCVRKYKNIIGMIPSYSGGPKIVSYTYLKSIQSMCKSKKEIGEILEREKPDIVVTNSLVTAYISKVAYKKNIPVVSFIRETRRNDLGTIINERFLSKYSKKILFLSKYDKEKYNIPTNKCDVIYNSIKTDVYDRGIRRFEACSELGIREDKFNVAFLGGTSEIKGWDIVKEIAEKQIEDIHFIIAGNNCNQVQLDNITYLGVMDNIELCLKAADVLIFPVKFPHQGRPIFEAGLFGIPVIIPDYPLFYEMVSDGENGLYYEPENSKDLLDKIMFFKNHPQKIKQMGNNNYLRTVENHSYDKNRKRILNIFKSV